MDFKFDKEPAGEAAAQGKDKGRQTILLMVLLLLLGGFGYLYFFTGLIRPQEQPAPPQPAPQVVKQPLPARDGATTAAPTPAAAPIPAAAPAGAPPVAAAKPAETTKPAAAVPPAKQVSAPQAVAPQKPAQPATKTVEKKAVAATAKPVTPPVASPAKAEPPKPAPAVKPVPASPMADRKAAPVKPAAKGAAPAKIGGPWTLVVGSYLVEERLAADMAKVKKVGLTPVMTSGQRRVNTMHRLKYGDYANREAAQQAVELLKRKAGDGFSIQKAGKYEVFAGSYAQLESAQAEQQRLASAGLKLTIQKTQVGVPTRKLTAGTYTDRAAAEVALKKLKQAGVGTPVLE